MSKFPKLSKHFKTLDVNALINIRDSGFDMLNKWMFQPKQVSLRDCVLNLVDLANPYNEIVWIFTRVTREELTS